MIQLKDLCTNCEHWTITHVTHDGETATFTCTHCNNAFQLPWNTETRLLIRHIRFSLKKRTKKNPELLNLKAPGDHVKLEPKPPKQDSASAES